MRSEPPGAAHHESGGDPSVEAARPEAQPASGGGGSIGAYFKFDERGTNLATEARAGLTTFMVMAYIIF
ncbi:MAG: NCS2 family permease, partial [Candidatus Limnocylindrales bacterium]